MRKNLRSMQMLFLLSIFGFMTNNAMAVPAFPGAEGGGANATGGRGGDVYQVTNLNNSGDGSLRYGIENASGARTIVFKVGGVIQLASYLIINDKSNITIAGQTAPGDGITLAGDNIDQSLMNLRNSNNIIVRYVRFRKDGGVPISQDCDCVSVDYGCHDIIFDHCSLSWATDENFCIWADNGISKNITLQWSISSEGLMSHSCGFIAGSNDNAESMTDISVHHNLFAHNNNRSPLLKVKSADIINNIIYNWGWWSTGIGGGIGVDIVGNLYAEGCDSGYRREVLWKPHDGTQCTGPSGNPSIYFSENTGPNNNDQTADAWSLMLEMTALTTWGWPDLDNDGYPAVEDVPSLYKRTELRTTSQPAITINQASDLDNLLLRSHGIGTSQKLNRYGSWIENRDEVDKRIINEYSTGTGGVVNYGTSSTLTGGAANPDNDNDGMPDVWEALYGVNDKDADPNNDGYTNLEEFLNGTDPLRVLHFNFNEFIGGTGYDADSQYSCSLRGGLSFSDDSIYGISGRALLLNGTSDYAKINPNPSYSGDFSVAAWIKFSTKPASEGFGIFSVSPDNGCTRMRVAIGIDGKLTYGLYYGSWARRDGIGDDLSDGKWHHVAVTFDRDGVASSYIDGVLQDNSLSIAAKPAKVQGTHYIGYDSFLLSKYFNGVIDEVKEYNVVLSQTQVERLAKDIPVDFTFDERSGTIAYDKYGNFSAKLKSYLTFDSNSVSGKTGLALSFNESVAGYQRIDLSNNPEYAGDFTLAAWVKIPAANKPAGGYGIISNPSGDIRFRFAIKSDGKLWFGLYDGNRWINKYGVGNDLCDNQWHHVAVTFDRDGDAQGYVDGVATGTPLTISTHTGIANGAQVIGGDTWIAAGNSAYMRGCIDGVKQFNRLLSSDEINCLANP